MRETFIASLFGIVTLIICEIFLIYIACTHKANDGKFRYEDAYTCIWNENYTSPTAPGSTTTVCTETVTDATVTVVTRTTTPTTSTVTEPTTLPSHSTVQSPTPETTMTTDTTNAISPTRSESSSYSETPSSTASSMQSTTPNWTKSTARSTSTTSCAITTNTVKTSTSSKSATTITDVTGTSDTPSGTWSQIPSDMTSTVETTYSSITTKMIRDTTTVAASSQTSSPDESESSSIDTSPTTTSAVVSSSPPTVPPTTLSPTSPSTLPPSSSPFTSTTVTENTSIDIDMTDSGGKTCYNDFDYIIRYATTNVACILVDMRIGIYVHYTMKDSQTGKGMLKVPRKVRTTGYCGEKTAKMTLNWDEFVEAEANNNDKGNRIIFHYVHNDVKFYLDSVFVDVHLDSRNFPRALQNRISGSVTGLQLFYAPVKDGMFTCKTETAINFGNQITAIISDIRLIAFNNCNISCWKTENNCTFKINVNIGAMIGAAIIGILLIVIIFYLMWRKRRNNFTSFNNFTDNPFPRKTIVLRKWLDKSHR